MAKDMIIQEINKFFLMQGFEEILINKRTVFKFKDGSYYFLSQENKINYYLEYAQTLTDAEKGLYEDMAAYQIGPGADSLIFEIKSDIVKYIIKDKANAIPDLESIKYKYAT